MTKQPIEVIIAKDGTARFVYSEQAAAMLAPLGSQEIRRASHVEPTEELSTAAQEWLRTAKCPFPLPPALWWADMLPSGGPVLGPFDSRQLALDAEAAWLHENKIPPPR